MATGFEDPYLTCPLDEVHRIRKSRMQCHLTKCLKNHSLVDKIKCPFNPLHIIYPNEMAHHMTVCESNASVAVQNYDRNDQKGFSGIISEQEAMRQLEEALGSLSNEVEYKHAIDTPGYDPVLANIDKPLFRTLNCESKSKRKEFRLTERKRIAAIEAERGLKLIEPIQERPTREVRELQPIRSQSILAVRANDDFQHQDQPAIDNHSSTNGIVGDNKEHQQQISSNHNQKICNGSDSKATNENQFNPIANVDQPSTEDAFDEISMELELLAQKEHELQRQKQELMMKLSERATQTRVKTQSSVDKVSDEPAIKNPFKINNHLMTNEVMNSLSLEEEPTALVKDGISTKPAYSGVAAKKPPTPSFELSSHLQSSAWNVVAKQKLDGANTSAVIRNSTSKPVEAPVVNPEVQPVVQPVAQLAAPVSVKENTPVVSSPDWTTVSRSKKVSTQLSTSIRKPKITSRDSSPVREALSHKAVISNETTIRSESQSALLDAITKPREPSPSRESLSWRNETVLEEPSQVKNVATKLREPSPAGETLSWRKETVLKDSSSSQKSLWDSFHKSRETSPAREATSWSKVAAPKEAPIVKLSSWSNAVKSREPSPLREAISLNKTAAPKELSSSLKSSWSNVVKSREPSPAREASLWNKVPMLKETSTTPDSPQWTVLVSSKKVSSSQQCTQWKVAPKTTETSKTSEVPKMISPEKITGLNESASGLNDLKSKSRPVLKDSSQKCTLVSTAVTSTVSSSYSTMAKITKDKPSDQSVTSSKVGFPEFLPIPRRSKLVAPVAGRGIVRALDEIQQQKRNDIISRRLRPGSASSFCSSFEQIEIDGVYGYEETV